MNLYCERCGNKIGERNSGKDGLSVDTISIKIRGARRRVYVVQVMQSIDCDYCCHVGPPFPSVLSVAEMRALRGYV